MPMEMCGFCRHGIPVGATVCAGCGAELHEGASQEQRKVAATIGLLGGMVLAFVFATGFLIGCCMAAGGGLIGGVIAEAMFSSQRSWKRLHNTRA